MSLFKQRMSQLKEYSKEQTDQVKVSNKLIERYREKGRRDKEYYEFKKSLLYIIDNLFNMGKTKIVIKPKSEVIKLYEKLMEDVEFSRYYDTNVVNKSELEIKLREM